MASLAGGHQPGKGGMEPAGFALQVAGCVLGLTDGIATQALVPGGCSSWRVAVLCCLSWGENAQVLSGVGAQTILGSSWWLSQSWQLETLRGVQLAAGTVVL